MLRTRKKKIPALGLAIGAALILLLGVAMLGNGAFAGFLIAGGLFALVYCAYFMGQRGVHSEIEIDASYYCYGDEPCGHRSTKPGRDAGNDEPCAHRCPGPAASEPAAIDPNAPASAERRNPPPTE